MYLIVPLAKVFPCKSNIEDSTVKNFEFSFTSIPFPIKSCLYGTGFLYFVSYDIVTPNSSSFCFLAQSARNPISSSIAVISPPCTLPG